MPSYYKEIQGYGDEGVYALYNAFVNYHKTIQIAGIKTVMVEIGVWRGKSLCYFLELAKEQGLKSSIQTFAIDNFTGEINATDQQEIIKQHGGSVYYDFLSNMRTAGVLDMVTAYPITSEAAVNLFDDNSIDTLFLDSEHLYDHVKDQLDSWYSKVKEGGFIGLHDYYEGTQVKKAVDEFVSDNKLDLQLCGTCAIFRKKFQGFKFSL